MARERMQDNDEEKLQNTGEDYKDGCVGFRDKLHQIFIAILHFNEVTVDVVEVEAARESLVRGSV